jgi:hypothetical protein
MRGLTAGGLLVSCMIGCGPTVPTPVPVPPPAELPEDPVEGAPAPEMLAPPEPRVMVDEMEGASREEAERLLLDTREELEECAGETAGLIRIHLTGSLESTRMTIDPESMMEVDSHTRTCVLQALSTVDLGESLSTSPSPSDRPTGFTAQLTVSW